MTDHDTLPRVAREWVKLWNAPVDWDITGHREGAE